MPASGPEPGESQRRRSGPRVWLKRLAYRTGYRVLQAYLIVRRPRSRGVKCVLVHRDEVVLVRHTYGPREVWHVPGGGARRSESVRQAADREMEEELGVRGLQWRDLPPATSRVGRRRVRIPCLRAELPGPELAPDAAEIAEARLFSPDHLPRTLVTEDRSVVAAATSSPGPAGARDGRHFRHT